MNKVMQKSVCGQCGVEILESPTPTDKERQPCPKCGSLGRAFQVSVFDAVQVHSLLKVRHRIPGRKKPQTEIVSGEDFHRDSATWRVLERIINRGTHWYTETIKDAITGEVLIHVSESLKDHVGHGSDKLKIIK